MSELTLNILGFPAVNNDLTVVVREPATNQVIRTGRPFLDGSLRLADIAPGAYELAVSHPNLTLPVIRRPIRVLPSGDTRVSVMIDPSQFRNTPIADIPDANLGPVRDTITSVAETVLPLSHKQPGESIRADDWNAMAGAIRDLAVTVAELTRLVTPTGHDHPELSAKFDEVTTNFSQLVNTLSTAMAELQRQIQAERYRTQVEDFIVGAGSVIHEGQRAELLNLVGTLEANVTESPIAYNRRVQHVGVQLSAQISDLIQSTPELASVPEVVTLTQSVDLLRTQHATSYVAELEHHRQVDRLLGAGGLSAFRKGVS